MGAPYKIAIILPTNSLKIHRSRVPQLTTKTMARLSGLPKERLLRDMPEKDKQRDALQWLRCNPDEKPITAARACNVENHQTLKKAWQRERKKLEALRILKKLWGQQGKQEKPRWGGQNKILRDDQHAALIQYAVSHAINGGKGATKQMMFNCAMHLRREEKKSPPLWRWFQEWLKGTPELHVIKTKPITSHRVDLHTEQALRRWFEDELLPVTEEHNIQYS